MHNVSSDDNSFLIVENKMPLTTSTVLDNAAFFSDHYCCIATQIILKTSLTLPVSGAQINPIKLTM